MTYDMWHVTRDMWHVTHDTHPTPLPTHTHPTPNLGGCEEDLSKKTALDGTEKHTNGHGDSMTDPAQRAESVKIIICLTTYLITQGFGKIICHFLHGLLVPTPHQNPPIF